VVKLGGSALEDSAALDAIVQDLVLMQFLGQKLVVVHGGGKAIERALAQADITPQKIKGRRITDEKTLEIVVRVLDEEISPDLVARIKKCGGLAVGCSYHLKSAPADRELGYVGRVTEVNVGAIEEALNSECMLVLPCLGFARDDGFLNINADDAASAVATQWQAWDLIFITDTPGLLRNPTDPSSVIRRINSHEVNELITSGVITGGMIPKVQGCLAALEQGVERVLILDGRVHHALLWESLSGECIGTEFVK